MRRARMSLLHDLRRTAKTLCGCESIQERRFGVACILDPGRPIVIVLLFVVYASPSLNAKDVSAGRLGRAPGRPCDLMLSVASGVDGDALRRVLRGRRFRDGNGEHAVLERRLRLLLVDFEGQRDTALEAAVVVLAEAPALVLALGFLLAADREDVVVHEDLDVLLVDARELRRDADLVVGRIHLEARPRCPEPARRAPKERRHTGVEAVEYVVEQPVHLAMKRHEGADLIAWRHARDRAAAAAPGDQISHCHWFFLLLD